MDKEEFTRAVLEYESTLYRVAKSMLGSEADCADAAQNALLRAWEKQHTLRDTAYFKTWLTRILINECRAMLRQRARFVPLEEEAAEGEIALVRAITDKTSALMERAEALDKAVAAVPGGVRESARYCAGTVLPAMEAARAVADQLELLVDRSHWPFPTYRDLLFYV